MCSLLEAFYGSRRLLEASCNMLASYPCPKDLMKSLNELLILSKSNLISMLFSHSTFIFARGYIPDEPYNIFEVIIWSIYAA